LGAAKRARGVPAERIPPGQYLPRGWPALHYGPVPRFKPSSWDLRVFGAAPAETVWSWEELGQLPTSELVADFHCVTKFTVLDNEWCGVACSDVLRLAPPLDEATHVMVWAEYGYSANMALTDFAQGMLATHRNGAPLTPEHGFPLRLVVPHLYAWKGPKWVRGIEYLTSDRRGFWEERGYHNRADPWREERYAHQEGQEPPRPRDG
jgi:DMSO/TMAO reductase YedYZ molybdopterin-dependent catalytic subunit